MTIEALPALQRIKDELRCRRTHLVRHGSQSLERHLIGTYDILTAWRQPERVAHAGLVHSVYSTDVFNHQTFTLGERDSVRGLVGEAAERLAYLFCIVDRKELLSAVRATSGDAPDRYEVTGRRDGQPVQVDRADAGDLVAIYMANAAEQTCRPDRSPALWLSNVSRLGRSARSLAEVIPPVFDQCTSTISAADETALLDTCRQLSTRLDRTDDQPGHRDGDRDVGWPVAEPLVWAGVRALAHGRPDAAAEFGRAAAARLRQWATPWDKRLTLQQWLALCATLADTAHADELAFVIQRFTAARSSGSGAPERLFAEIDRAGLLPADGPATRSAASELVATESVSPPARAEQPARPVLPTRFQTYLAGLRNNHRNPRMRRYPGLRSAPWHDPQQFRLACDLEAIAADVAAEAHALSGNDFHDESEPIERSGRWSVLFLYERGRKNEKNCSLCPRTVAAIEANRTVLSLGGLAYFSRLGPDTQITPHAGPTNMRLRCHLGIDVPDGCGMRVGGITHTWREGRCVVFDDSFTHEVWNHSTRDRLVLIVDLWHPDLTDDEVALLNGMHRYATATGLEITRYWKHNRATKADAGQRDSPPSGG
jgi:hypothetical protein